MVSSCLPEQSDATLRLSELFGEERRALTAPPGVIAITPLVKFEWESQPLVTAVSISADGSAGGGCETATGQASV